MATTPREQRGDCYWGRTSDGSPCTLPGHDHAAAAPGDDWRGRARELVGALAVMAPLEAKGSQTGVIVWRTWLEQVLALLHEIGGE